MGLHQTRGRDELRRCERVAQSGRENEHRGVFTQNVCYKKYACVGVAFLAEKFTLSRWNVRVHVADAIPFHRVVPLPMEGDIATVFHSCNIRAFVNILFHIDSTTWLLSYLHLKHVKNNETDQLLG